MNGLAPGRHLRIFDAYIEQRERLHNGELTAEEAMSVSDFPTYMGTFLRHSFLERFTELQGAWAQYTRDFSVDDFEEYTSSRFGRFADIPQKALNGEYTQLTITEASAEKIQLKEYGAGFALTRQLVISDRLNKLSDLPTMFAEALARTMSKKAAAAIEDNAVMFDSNALLSSAHNNLGAATALTATVAGSALLQALELKLFSQTDAEGYAIQPNRGNVVMLYPVELRWIVKALMENEQLLNGSNILEPNLVRGTFTGIEEPFFTDANNYYMASDLKGPMGPIAHVTLAGNNTPFLGVKDPGVRAVLGGDDPYSFDFDEIEYKIRHDFDFKPVEWRGFAGALPS